MLESILTSETLSIKELLICSIASLIFGFIIALVHKKTGDYSKNFLITLTVIPLLVESVILMVNGNLGTAIGVASAFSLIRFRSLPGNSKEILSIFASLTIGLATGMGEVLFALIITILSSISIYALSKFLTNDMKVLKVLIPEDMDYTDIFKDTFNKFNIKYNLINVKTVNLGSLFELTYKVDVKDNDEKEFIDDIRIKNGNLKVSLSQNIENEL